MSAQPTSQEKMAELPGDHLVPHADVVSDAAVTINGTPEEVFGYLAQMGPRHANPDEDRGGWPMGEATETFIPTEKRGKRDIVPSLALKEGDIITDWFSGKTPVEAKVVEVNAPHSIVFASTREAKKGKKMDVSWALVTKAQEDGMTRLQTRLRVGSVKHHKLVSALGGVVDRTLIAGLRDGINERLAGKPEPSEKGLKALKIGAVAGAVALAYVAGRKAQKAWRGKEFST